MVPNLETSDVLGLKLPETINTSCAGQDIWDVQFNNLWGPNVGIHCDSLKNHTKHLEVANWCIKDNNNKQKQAYNPVSQIAKKEINVSCNWEYAGSTS